jgi:hypothetical protein
MSVPYAFGAVVALGVVVVALDTLWRVTCIVYPIAYSIR